MKQIFSFVSICLLSLISFSVFAVPANPGLVTVTLSDGTEISYYVKGDEKVHWMQSPEGYTLLYNSDKQIVYAEKDAEGNLTPSAVKYTNNHLRSSETKAFLARTLPDLRYSLSQIETLRQIWEMTDSEIQRAPVNGNKKALCVLAGFKNRAFSKTIEEFENLMNQVGYSVGGARGSVKDFYRENSYGQMDLTVTVVGPYTVINNESYYCTQANDRGYQYFADEVARLANADVNFQDFAINNRLETFHIIFAGYGAENGLSESQYIWSHKWQLYTPITLDGVRISVYSCSPEFRGTSGSNITYIGVICHELCHVFGSDDYYDTNYSSSGGDYPATGDWDLMASGSWNDNGRTPAHINMFQKILYEWVTPVTLNSPKTVSNMPNSAQNPVAYVIKPYTNNEMYVLENRQKIGFDSYVRGTGLLIYHIHNSAASGTINNTQHPQQAYVVASNATMAIPTSSVSSYGSVNSSTAPFTNASGRNEFSGTSAPRMFRWNGSNGIAVTDKPVTEITQSNQLVSFLFMGGENVFYNPVDSFFSQVTDNSVNLTWTPPSVSGYTGYKLYKDNALLIESDTWNTSYTDSVINNGNHQYCIVVKYDSNESEVSCLTVDVRHYPPVSGFNASVSNNTVSLNWSNPLLTGYTGYKIYKDSLLLHESDSWTNAYTDLEVENGNYQYCIAVKYGSVVSEIKCLSTTVNNVSIPDNLSLDAVVSENNVLLTWNISTPHTIVGFILSKNEVLVDSLAENVYNYVDSNLVNGAYTYAIQAVYEGNLASDRVDLDVLVDYYSPVSILSSTVNKDTITLSWSIASSPQLETFDIYQNGYFVHQAALEESEWIDKVANGNYTYCIIANYNNYKTSLPVCTDATVDYVAPEINPVRNLSAEYFGNTVLLTWNKPISNLTPSSYKIYNFNQLLATVSSVTTKYIDENRIVGMNNYCIVAVYGNMESDPECIEIEFKEYQCMPVTNLTAHRDSVEDQSVLLLDWVSPNNAFDVNYWYDVYLNDAILYDSIPQNHIAFSWDSAGEFKFGVKAHSQYCVSAREDIIVTYINIVEQPQGGSVCLGEEYTLNVIAEPSNLKYQWYFNNNLIAGATNNHYTIPEVNDGTTGTYHVVAKNSTGVYQQQSANVEIHYRIPAINYQLFGIPESIHTDSTYLIYVKLYSDEPVSGNYDWSFSNDLASLVPAETPDSIYLIIGSEEGVGTLSLAISSDCWASSVEKEINVTRKIGIPFVQVQDISLYPNPVSDVLTVSSNDSDISTIIITDINGREIYFLPQTSEKIQSISTSAWAKGIYFIRIGTKEGMKVGKIIKN